MNEELRFRQARPADATRIMQIIRQAQAQMRALGSRQWQDGYPALANIERDIAKGWGFVFEKPGVAASADPTSGVAEETPAAGSKGPSDKSSVSVIAYGAVIFDGEPAYDALDGSWLTSGDYVVLHRLAVADEEKGRGVAREFMLRVEALAHERNAGSFRVDTNFDNRYMLQIFERLGFSYCGKIVYDSGERLAFEKPFVI